MSARPITLVWDANRKAAPYESDEWASSDRGWLRARANTPRMREFMHNETVCLGHYLDYETDASLTVHAVSCVTRESSYHATPQAAQAWLEEQANGKAFAFVVAQSQRYQHEKDDVARRYGAK